MGPSKKKKIEKEIWTLKPCEMDPKMATQMRTIGLKRFNREKNLTRRALRRMSYFTQSKVSSMKSRQKSLRRSHAKSGIIIETLSEYERRMAIEKNYENIIEKYTGFEHSLSPILTKPEVELPQESYKLTERSKKNYRKHIRDEERLKKNDIIENTKKKMEELKKIKEIMDATKNKFTCHKYEREHDRIIKKKKYIENLAHQLGCQPEDLKHKEEELYQKHEQQELELRKLKRDRLNKDLEWMERFVAEFPIDKPEKPKTPKKPKKIKEIEVEHPVEIPIGEGFTTQPEEILEEVDKKSFKGIDPEKITSDLDLKKGRRSSRVVSMKRKPSRRKTYKRKTTVRLTIFRRKSRQSIKRKQSSLYRRRRGSAASITSAISMTSHHHIETAPVSVLDGDLLETFKAFAEFQKEKRLFRKTEKLIEIPKDVFFKTIPSNINFYNFVPGKIYNKKLQIFNRGGHKIYFKPDSVEFETDTTDIMLITLDPWMAFYAHPTEPVTFKVTFSPLESTGHIECDIIFATRHNATKWKQFSVHVSCTPMEPRISLNTNFISFKGNKIWNDEMPVKNLIIKNKGLVPCHMTITSSLSPPNIDHQEYIEDEEDFKYPFIITKLIIIKNIKNDEIIYDQKENEIIYDQKENKVVTFYPKLMEETLTLPAQSKTYIPIGFVKKNGYGILKDEWHLNFTSHNFKKEEKVKLEAFIEYRPLFVDPHVLDFQVVLINDGVQQNSFRVTNIGNKAFKLQIKIPKELNHHVHIPQRSPVVTKKKTISILVRLAIKSSFCHDASKYLDSSTNVLNFPISITTTEPSLSGPPIKVHVMAIITRSMGITIKPQVLSLGKVYTHETIIASFYIVNHTLATHYYGFLNLPKWVMIQPNYGFGVIAPGEILDLELLFSPGVEQMDEPGNTVFRSFILKCTTAERLAHLNNIDAYKETEVHNSRSKLYWIKPEDLLFPDEISTPSIENLTEVEPVQMALRPADSFDIQELSQPSEVTRAVNEWKEELLYRFEVGEEDEIAEIPPLCIAKDRLFAIMGVKALVCDPRCELSAQIVVLKPTSYSSFSITKLYLRCPNRVSGAHCYCGRAKGAKHEWNSIVSRFEFFSNHPFLSVEPCKGEISMNQEIKISLIMRPQPPFQEIDHLARMTKARAEEIRLLTEWFENQKKRKKKSSQRSGRKKSVRRISRRISRRRSSRKKSVKRISVKMTRKKSNSGRRTSKRASLSKDKKDKYERNRRYKDETYERDIIPTFSIDPASVTLSTSDLTEALIEILKITEPKDFKCKVKCLIETKSPSHIPIQYEELDLDIYGTIITPDFVLFSGTVEEKVPPQNFAFPITAIGSKSKLEIEICNTSGRDIVLQHSPFQTNDVFWCPSPQPLYQVPKTKKKKVRKGIFMEPGQVIKFPIVFQPEKVGEVFQYIDFYTKNTYVPTRIEGVGVIPLYTITPEFNFAKMKPTSYAGVAKCAIIIKNFCEAELKFIFKPLSIKESPQFELRKSIYLTQKTPITDQTPIDENLESGSAKASAQINAVAELFAMFEETIDDATRAMSKIELGGRESKKKISKKDRRLSDYMSKRFKNTTLSNFVHPQIKNAIITSENIQEIHIHYFKFTESVTIPPMGVGHIHIDFRACPFYMFRTASTTSWKSLKHGRESYRKSLRKLSTRKSIRPSNLRDSVTSALRKPGVTRLSKYGESMMPEEEEDSNYYLAHTRLYYAGHVVVQDYYFLGIPGETARRKASNKSKYSLRRMSRRSSRRIKK